MTKLPTVAEIVKSGNPAIFDYLRGAYAYYTISIGVETYRFPVEIADLDGATINKIEKGINMMRYIRKAIQDNTLVKV